MWYLNLSWLYVEFYLVFSVYCFCVYIFFFFVFGQLILWITYGTIFMVLCMVWCMSLNLVNNFVLLEHNKKRLWQFCFCFCFSSYFSFFLQIYFIMWHEFYAERAFSVVSVNECVLFRVQICFGCVFLVVFEMKRKINKLLPILAKSFNIFFAVLPSLQKNK